MGIFNSFGAMSGQFAAKQERNQVAQALSEELQTPQAVESLLQAVKRSAPEAVMQWTKGNTGPMAADQLQQLLSGTGLLEKLSGRTNMPPGVVKSSLAVLLPLAIHHLKATVPAAGESGQPTPGVDPLLQALLQ